MCSTDTDTGKAAGVSSSAEDEDIVSTTNALLSAAQREAMRVSVEAINATTATASAKIHHWVNYTLSLRREMEEDLMGVLQEGTDTIVKEVKTHVGAVRQEVTQFLAKAL